MNIFRISHKALSAAALMWLTAGMLTACSDDTDYDNPSGETYIYSIAVANGGFTGAENINGTIDEESHTIEFTIPAETDIEAVRFTTKLSLGAKLDKDAYDVSAGSTDLVVTNNENSTVYHAIFNLMAPKEQPVLTSIVCRNDAGEERQGFVSDVTGTVYLNCDGSLWADVVSVGMIPRRTAYTLSTATDGRISADNPGKLLMDFMGLTKEYDISFAGVPVFGADWSSACIFSFSKHEGGMIWEDFSAENTRRAQFDGNSMLIDSRPGGTNPKVILYDDVKAGSPVEHLLDKTGISKGTFEVSSGSIQHGHYYICNMTTGIGADSPLKVYHWSSMDAPCETLLDFPGNDAVKGRWGDNMSVCLDEAGNGYLWFFDNTQGGSAVRFAVTAFTQVNPDPEVIITPYSVAYYATLNPVPDEPNLYVLTSSYQRSILLVDSDLNLVNIIEGRDGVEFPVAAEQDARVVAYNGERYLITCSGQFWNYRKPQTFRVYDISAGLNTSLAFSNFNQGEHPILFQNSLDAANAPAWSAQTGAGIGPDGLRRVMACSTRSGFIMAEVPKKR